MNPLSCLSMYTDFFKLLLKSIVYNVVYYTYMDQVKVLRHDSSILCQKHLVWNWRVNHTVQLSAAHLYYVHNLYNLLVYFKSWKLVINLFNNKSLHNQYQYIANIFFLKKYKTLGNVRGINIIHYNKISTKKVCSTW